MVSPELKALKAYSFDFCYSLLNVIINVLILEKEHDMEALKLRKIGNSLGLVIPKEILVQIGVGEGDLLFLVENPEGGYQLTPYDPEFEKQMKIAEQGMVKYKNTLKELAR